MNNEKSKKKKDVNVDKSTFSISDTNEVSFNVKLLYSIFKIIFPDLAPTIFLSVRRVTPEFEAVIFTLSLKSIVVPFE